VHPTRAIELNMDIVRDYSQKLHKIMFEKNFIGKPEYMYNMGENG
jgi:hypothetical protein